MDVLEHTGRGAEKHKKREKDREIDKVLGEKGYLRFIRTGNSSRYQRCSTVNALV